MSRNLQLHIPTTCHENWANMHLAEQGRHCAACQKTVVDFTTMTDQEIIRHIALASSNVCGRFTPDQMNRNLASLSPVQWNGGSGWRWLLTGLLITSNPPESTHYTPPLTSEHRMPSTGDTTQEVMLGMVVVADRETKPVEPERKHPVTIKADTDHIVMGKIAATIPDSVSGPTVPSLDTALLAKKNISCGPELSGTVGGVSIGISLVRLDSIRQFITDTLTTLHLLPKSPPAYHPASTSSGPSVPARPNHIRSSY